jgi:hypothetical protein
LLSVSFCVALNLFITLEEEKKSLFPEIGNRNLRAKLSQHVASKMWLSKEREIEKKGYHSDKEMFSVKLTSKINKRKLQRRSLRTTLS